jgi:hypothetical protein
MTHEVNLLAWVGCVSHFYYQFHLTKFHDKKTNLTREIARFGDDLLRTNRQLKALDSSNLTKYTLSFKTTGKSIRVDKSTAKEVLGADTLYRLSANKKQASKPANSTSGRKSGILNAPRITLRKKPNNTHEESDSDPEMEEVSDHNGHSRKRKATKSNSETILRQKNLNTDESKSRGEIEEVDDNIDKIRASKPIKSSTIIRRNVLPAEFDGEVREADHNPHSETLDFELQRPTENVQFYRHLCSRLADQAKSQRLEIDSLRSENESLKNELAKAHKSMKNNEGKSGDEEGNESRKSNLLAGTNIEPAKDLPADWKERSVKIKCGRTVKTWYSPVNSLQFRSKVTVKKFLEILKSVNGDEDAAKILYDQETKEKSPKKQVEEDEEEEVRSVLETPRG